MFLGRCVFKTLLRNTLAVTFKAICYSDMSFAVKTLTNQVHEKSM